MHMFMNSELYQRALYRQVWFQTGPELAETLKHSSHKKTNYYSCCIIMPCLSSPAASSTDHDTCHLHADQPLAQDPCIHKSTVVRAAICLSAMLMVPAASWLLLRLPGIR